LYREHGQNGQPESTTPRRHTGSCFMSRRTLFRGLTFLLTLLAGFWTSPARGQLLVTDFVNGAVLRFDPITGAPLSPLIPAGSLFQPSAMVIGPDNLLYVANQATNVVARYDPFTGAHVGSDINMGANYAPGGLRFGSDGNLYVSRFVA